jgi:hypothetical protein
MNPEDIPGKTPKGLTELETRAFQLPAKLRQALVRVDGVKSLEVLVAEAGTMGEALGAQLTQLLAQGFIANASRAAAPARPAPQQAAQRPMMKPPDALAETLPLNPDPQWIRVNELKAAIRWLLAEAMDGKPSPMELALNHCRTLEDLDRLIDEAFAAIQLATGKPRAAHFWREAKALVNPAA